MRNIAKILAAALLVLGTQSALAEDTVFHVVSPVPFGEASGATSEVKAQCELDTKLPEFIEEHARRGVKVVIGEEPAEGTAGKILKLEIVNVLGTGGGAWSGAKSVTVRGELWENGEKIGSFVASRYSGGGAFGGFKGTCSILGRCVKALGEDIAAWLRNPSMDAMLGDA